MHNGGRRLGPLNRFDIGGYISFTTCAGENVLWHPDRKFFLLGKIITPDPLKDPSVPKS